MSSSRKWQKITPEVAKQVLHIIIRDADLFQGLSIYGDVWISVFWDSQKERVGDVFLVQALWVALDACTRNYGLTLDKIRTVCQILWQQPAYPSRGSLTLCEASDKGGLLLCED